MVKPFQPIEFHNNGYIASPLTKRVAPQEKDSHEQQSIAANETIIDIGENNDYGGSKIEGEILKIRNYIFYRKLLPYFIIVILNPIRVLVSLLSTTENNFHLEDSLYYFKLIS